MRKRPSQVLEPTPKALTYSLLLFEPAGLHIYIARVPAAPFAIRIQRVALRNNSSVIFMAPYCYGRAETR